MNDLYNERLTRISQTLRKNMTPEERHLWYDFFKPRGIKARRQKVMGPYVVDFFIPTAKLVIELDGSRHYESEKQRERDERRDAWLQEQGLSVVRYDNRDVRDRFESVCLDILQRIRQGGCNVQLPDI